MRLILIGFFVSSQKSLAGRWASVWMAVFLADNSCRLLSIVFLDHLQATATNQWLVYRRIEKETTLHPHMDEHDHIGEGVVSGKAGIGSKLLKLNRRVLLQLWVLFVQSDPTHFVDWHTSALVANGIITRSHKSFGYSCAHMSHHRCLATTDEYADDLMNEEDLSDWSVDS